MALFRNPEGSAFREASDPRKIEQLLARGYLPAEPSRAERAKKRERTQASETDVEVIEV